VWLSLGGQARGRGEYYNQYLFGASRPQASDAYLLSRFRLSADLHVTPYFRMFAEGRASFALDRDLEGGRTTSYVDEFDLMNSFADIMIPFGEQASVTLRGGRQELLFGSQRLVGPGDFTQVPRTFNGTSGREHRQTLGVRTWGKIGQTNLDFEVEGAGQFGSVGNGSVAAGMFTAVLGYTVPVHWSPRVYLEFDYASGDKSPGGNVGTFNPLYPNAHSYLGYIDYIGRQNIISASGGLIATPIHDLTLSLQQYFFWRASDRDAIYNKAGDVLRPGTGTTARYVGAEVDLLATYNFTRHVQFYAGYSHFFPGEFIEKTGPSRGSDFLYGAIQYTF
jgi:hypothetical protein